MHVCFSLSHKRRAERVARQLACKTFDQMAGELKA
jgi:hypothetical protein